MIDALTEQPDPYSLPWLQHMLSDTIGIAVSPVGPVRCVWSSLPAAARPLIPGGIRATSSPSDDSVADCGGRKLRYRETRLN